MTENTFHDRENTFYSEHILEDTFNVRENTFHVRHFMLERTHSRGANTYTEHILQRTYSTANNQNIFHVVVSVDRDAKGTNSQKY
jgi:hypothetical protein